VSKQKEGAIVSKTSSIDNLDTNFVSQTPNSCYGGLEIFGNLRIQAQEQFEEGKGILIIDCDG